MKADFQQFRNDLYWKIYDSEDGFISWGGYDDAYWWDNVSKSKEAQIRKGNISGRTYKLNFETGEVKISD